MRKIILFLGVLLLTLGLVVGSASAVLDVVSDADKTYIDYRHDGNSVFKIDEDGLYVNVPVYDTGGGSEYTGIQVIDVDVDFATLGSIHHYVLEIDAVVTTAVASTNPNMGRLYGASVVIHLDKAVTNTYGIMSVIEAEPSASIEVNDIVGVMGKIEMKGAFTVYQAASSVSALRGDISNACSGSWTGQVFTLMLNYGSNLDYDLETAWIHAYNNTDSKLDYGIHMTQKSTQQAITTGIWLDIEDSTTVTTGIHLDINSTGVLTTGIDIEGCATANIAISGTNATGIAMTGTYSVASISLGAPIGIKSIATFVPHANRTGYALAVGTIQSELDFSMVTASNMHFSPLQMNINVIGDAPTTGTINLMHSQLTHTSLDMPNLRLKCADFTITTDKNVLDMYAYQGEIDLTGDVAIGNEATVLGLVFNAGAGTVTGAVRGIAIQLLGNGMPSTNSIGIVVETGTNADIQDGIRVGTNTGTSITNALRLYAISTTTITKGILFDGGGTFTTGIDLGDDCTTAIDIGDATVGIQFAGTYSESAISIGVDDTDQIPLVVGKHLIYFGSAVTASASTGFFCPMYMNTVVEENVDLTNTAGITGFKSRLTFEGGSGTAMSSNNLATAICGEYFSDSNLVTISGSADGSALFASINIGVGYDMSGGGSVSGLHVFNYTNAGANMVPFNFSGILIGSNTGTFPLGNAIKVVDSVTTFLEIVDNDAIAGYDSNQQAEKVPDGWIRISIGDQKCYLWTYTNK